MQIEEVLVLHHSHLDVGYTHTQPIVWELQREFIDQALELLEATAGWDELSAPKWTIEVTAQVQKWLESADEGAIARLKRFLAQGRVGLSGLEFNTTPLCSAEQFVKQLEPIQRLRRLLGAEIRTANQHDVDGIPWSAVDLLADAGIELLIMAVNIHLGGPVAKRPSVFRWQGPSDREILVMNGAHYTMFDQLLSTWENSIERMQEGLARYLEHLAAMDYAHDFIYLTTAATPVCWDNSPPYLEVARLIREWNARGLQPRIRFITPNELLERIKLQPRDQYELLRGDWTDYWNFGCASTADVTRISRCAKQKLFKADLLEIQAPAPPAHYSGLATAAWRQLNLFDEHTWGSFNSMDPDNDFSKAQAAIKDHHAWQGHEIAEYLLVDRLEAFTGNAADADQQAGIAVFNFSGRPVREFVHIPEAWRAEGKRLRTARFGWEARINRPVAASLHGPVALPPWGWACIPFAELPTAEPDPSLLEGEIAHESVARHLNTLEKTAKREVMRFIESAYYRLEYDPATGRIIRLFDKINHRELLDASSRYTFFQFVRERPDPLFREDRRAYYARELEKEMYDVSCWNSDWHRIIETAARCLGCRVERTAAGITLILRFEAPGVENFTQRIMLHALKPLITLNAAFHKQEVRTPESLYFAFPLPLAEGWRCHFDSAGVPVELDAEQLPGASRDWFTVESFVALHEKEYGLALFCPDAPMVQAGGFNFGRRSRAIAREKNPLLLAWPLNNYWDTNFRPAQPGFISLTWHMASFAVFDAAALKQEAEGLKAGVEVHPALVMPKPREGRWFEFSDARVQLLHARRSADGQGMVLRLVSYAEQELEVSVSVVRMTRAERVTVLEEKLEELPVADGRFSLRMPTRAIVSVRLLP
ncbi:MAG TPA: glycoside hydrolase family 38 C-terminal domain-containing protein [bacterium]|nr:glycoside hydrolase family 38 C-terminal domain-containing protein [bacterium]HQJ65808.1 glycoside hydrolase family 38 C-terminal domain-containing protein [bacterium]